MTYTRYPFGDRNSRFEEIPAIVIGGNEHGTGGDPATPAMISARMIKDLCECKNAGNALINLLKNEYMMVFCPVVNPWGLHKDNKSYYNANGVNLDRNFDTPGWKPQNEEPNNWPTGDYGGSENETQYFMNTLISSKAKIAMCNHSYGHGIDDATGEAVSAGICSYMFGKNKNKYTEPLLKIAEVMASNYNLVFNDNGEAPPEIWAKTRSYFESVGIEGIALEINSRDGFITDPNNEAGGKQFTARVMEAGYTQLLQSLYMMMTLVSRADNTVVTSYTNQVPISTDSNGNVLNGVGYGTGQRLSSSGVLKECSDSVYTGFIPAKSGDVIRIYNAGWATTESSSNYICAYDASFNFICAVATAGSESLTSYPSSSVWYSDYSFDEDGNVLSIKLNADNIAYIRVSSAGTVAYDNITPDAPNIIVTINEEINN